MGEHNFFVRARPTEKLFLTHPQKNLIFLSLYFCGYFSEGTPSEKYFSDGIRIFLCVFARTEKCKIPVVTQQHIDRHCNIILADSEPRQASSFFVGGRYAGLRARTHKTHKVHGRFILVQASEPSSSSMVLFVLGMSNQGFLQQRN